MFQYIIKQERQFMKRSNITFGIQYNQQNSYSHLDTSWVNVELKEEAQNSQFPATSIKKQITSKHSVETNCTSYISNKSENSSIKNIGQNDQEDFIFQEKIPLQGIDFHTSTNFNSPVIQIKKSFNRYQQTFITHFKSTMKIDKYLRLVCSIIKTLRAYSPKTKLNSVYKELILTRRVIRWESKYDTIRDLIEGREQFGMIIFKIIQLTGDLVDLVSFWLKVIHKGTDTSFKVIDGLEQIESNFYFLECSIWFTIYTYRYFKLKKQVQNPEELDEIKVKVVENGMKSIKYLLDILTSYNNSSLKRVFGQINHKLAGFLTLFSSIIGIFLLWK